MGNYTDEEIYEVLKAVQLKETVESLPNKLDHRVIEGKFRNTILVVILIGGENWSCGQRQVVSAVD